jgi:hypothetical protein
MLGSMAPMVDSILAFSLIFYLRQVVEMAINILSSASEMMDSRMKVGILILWIRRLHLSPIRRFVDRLREVITIPPASRILFLLPEITRVILGEVSSVNQMKLTFSMT